MDSLTFFQLSYFESFLLIIISLGFWACRFYFVSFMKETKDFPFTHLLFLMIFTVFTSILVLFLTSYYYFNSGETFIEFIRTDLNYLVLLPRLIFFFSLSSFLYWLFNLLYTKQQYFVQIQNQYTELAEAYEHLSSVSLPKELVDLIHHEDFTSDFLTGYIFHNNTLVWVGEKAEKFPVESTQFILALDEIKQKTEYNLQTVETYKIVLVD